MPQFPFKFMMGRKEELGKNTLWLCPVFGFLCGLFCFDTFLHGFAFAINSQSCDIVVLMAHFFF